MVLHTPGLSGVAMYASWIDTSAESACRPTLRYLSPSFMYVNGITKSIVKLTVAAWLPGNALSTATDHTAASTVPMMRNSELMMLPPNVGELTTDTCKAKSGQRARR